MPLDNSSNSSQVGIFSKAASLKATYTPLLHLQAAQQAYSERQHCDGEHDCAQVN